MNTLTFRLRHTAILGLFLLILPLPAAAQAIAFREYLENWILPQILVALEGVTLVMLFYYGFRMILESQNESTLTTARKSFIYSFIGFACLATMQQVASAFVFVGAGEGVNTFFLRIPIEDVASYMVRIVEGILVLNLVFHAFRLLTSQGEEGAAEKSRKAIVQNIVGVVLVFLSDVGVRAVNAGTGGQQIIINELVGLANFILQLIAAISVIAILVAGILLIISVDESLKDRAKTIITGTIISLIIVIASYTLINIFV